MPFIRLKSISLSLANLFTELLINGSLFSILGVSSFLDFFPLINSLSPTSYSPITSPLLTTSPSALKILVITPSLAATTSITTLSVSISAKTSS